MRFSPCRHPKGGCSPSGFRQTSHIDENDREAKPMMLVSHLIALSVFAFLGAVVLGVF